MATNMVCFYFLFSFFLLVSYVFASGGLVGGLSSANTEDDSVKKAAQFAVSQINLMRNSMFNLKLVDVIEAKTQVVNGALYHLTLDVGGTNCRKGKQDNLDECDVDNRKIERCKLKVTESPEPNHHFSLSPNFNCKRKKLLGGEDDETDDRVSQAIAQFSIQQMDKDANATHKNVLVKLESVKKKVVAGQLYKLTFIMAESECDNDGEMSRVEDCPAKPDAKYHRCKVEVWIQAWMKPTHKLSQSACVEIDGSELSLALQRDRRNSPVVISMSNDITPVIVHKEREKQDKKILLGGDGHDIGNFGSFREFMQRYNKTYKDDDEMKRRFGIFRENMKKVVILNQGEQGPKDTRAKYGATVFADLSESEFRQHYLTPEWDLSRHPSRQGDVPRLSEPLPRGFDWREHGAVTGVKNQGMCGSCWAFSTTGNIEGQWYLRKKNLVSLSEQELVDCDKIDEGCNGGLPSQAYEAIMKLGGLESEKDYPYDGRGEKCAFSERKARVYINDSISISKNEDDMAAWLLNNGPISIGINAFPMQFYFGGISHPWKALCNPKSLDHGVLIVGFGVQKSLWGTETPYWIIKNSWGTWWGEKGYYRIYRGDGSCGLNQMCTSAVVE